MFERCLFCFIQLRAMRQRLAEFSDANARLQEKVIQLEAFLATSDQVGLLIIPDVL